MVTGALLSENERAAGAGVSIDARQLRHLRTVLADDPLRAVQSLPRVAAIDDFRSEFSVRGSPYRHIGVVIDGVETPWLQHAAYGRSAGSVSMLSTDVIESATLQAGAYPQRHGNRLGAQLGMNIRQGSRDRVALSGTISGTSAAIVTEGPLGATRPGSWLVAARQSLLEWPIKRRNPIDETVFGFTDAQAKIVFDPRPNQQIGFTALGGLSGVDGPDDRPAPGTRERHQQGWPAQPPVARRRQFTPGAQAAGARRRSPVPEQASDRSGCRFGVEPRVVVSR